MQSHFSNQMLCWYQTSQTTCFHILYIHFSLSFKMVLCSNLALNMPIALVVSQTKAKCSLSVKSSMAMKSDKTRASIFISTGFVKRRREEACEMKWLYLCSYCIIHSCKCSDLSVSQTPRLLCLSQFSRCSTKHMHVTMLWTYYKLGNINYLTLC